MAELLFEERRATWPQDSKFLRPGIAIILIGVSGSGKSTIGQLLGKSIPCPFIDADDFHSADNKGEELFLGWVDRTIEQGTQPLLDFVHEKMRSGIPLTEDDRLPWLHKLRDELAKYVSKQEWVVLACSALRAHYRDILLTADPSYQLQGTDSQSSSGLNRENHNFLFVFLKGSEDLLASRLAARHGQGQHFMSPSLLKSQIDLLELREGDEKLISVDVSLSPDQIVDHIKSELLLRL